ncbi:hypothetical protein ATANTOWER_015514 [Ataeniobius toweri]|uniref:Uncharacterized protein n=1 Tax=Ataeniobius toweri TaxID=208326 RepID=A0ABU7A0H7_9TELE|nr:hypothetical protein [Ataeniobius toweri]
MSLEPAIADVLAQCYIQMYQLTLPYQEFLPYIVLDTVEYQKSGRSYIIVLKVFCFHIYCLISKTGKRQTNVTVGCSDKVVQFAEGRRCSVKTDSDNSAMR